MKVFVPTEQPYLCGFAFKTNYEKASFSLIPFLFKVGGESKTSSNSHLQNRAAAFPRKGALCRCAAGLIKISLIR